MKQFNRYHLGIVPLLSILAMSPSVMQTQFASRSIASLEQQGPTEVKTEDPKKEEKPQSEEVKPETDKPVVQNDKPEDKPEVKPETDKPVVQNDKPEDKPEVKPETDKPVVQNDKPEDKPEVKPETDKPVAQNDKPEDKPEVKPETDKPVVQNDVKEEKKHPKLESIIAKVDKDSLTKDLNLSKEVIIQKLDALIKKMKEEKSSFKEVSDENIVKAQREQIESLIKDLIVLEAANNSDELSAEEKEANLKLLAEGKDILEGLLGSLENNEVLVAKAKEAKEDKPVVADKEEPKKEEPKTEEPKKEEDKPVVADKDEPKKEEGKKEVCESDEKNKVLTAQVEELMKQNQQILQTMMGMAQMMVSMHQQSQNQGIYQQYQMPMPNPYMYQQPMTAGNWVYYPSGFQPAQQNIFAQPMMMQQPMQQQMSIYPDQMHQQQSQWNLRPTQYFGDPRFQSQPLSYGTFGNDAFTFNMSNSVPTVIQS